MAETKTVWGCPKCGKPLTGGCISDGSGVVCWRCGPEVVSSEPVLVPRAALEDALEGLEEMLPFFEAHFAERTDLAGYAKRAKKALR